MWLQLLILTMCGVSAQYEPFPVISSSWSMWSPWSFCSNNVMIRVRACSTVRGYKCIGHNKEFQSCNSPPKRNNLDYEDPEAADREMAMKQLYQDYEPETPDEAKYAQTRGNRNFHMISPNTAPKVTTQAPTSTVEHFSVMNRGGTGVGISSDEFDYDETPRMAPVKPTNPSETTFEFAKYPKSTEEPTTTEQPSTTPSTTTTTTTEVATTTTVRETTKTLPDEPTPQTVTPQFSTHKVIDHEAIVEPEDVGFRGKYTLEEPLPEVSLPTLAGPPGTMAMEEPTTEEPTTEEPMPSSFPIDVDVDPTDSIPEPTLSEPVSDGSTHSVGSYSIGKEPTWEEEPIPLSETAESVTETAEPEIETETEPPTRNIPRFSISPSTRRLGEIRRAPASVNTHIEMPLSMLPFIPTTVQDDTATITTTEKPETTHPAFVSHLPINYRPKVPKIALVTAEQNMQHFPKLMNEQRAPPRPRSRTLPSPSEYLEEATTTRKPSKVTVEISRKTMKKRRRNRRLKKLNRLGKIRTVAVLPTEFTVPATEPMEKPLPTPAKFEIQEEKFLAPKPTQSWTSKKDRQVFEENRELEARIAALKNKVEMNRKILATMKMPEEVRSTAATETPVPVKKHDQLMLEGDTARALSWMINDMERMVDDKARTDVVDRLPVDKVDDAPGFKLGETDEDDATTTTMSPFPFPIPDNGFALIRSKRSIKEGRLIKKRILWSSWSEWTECQCGKQSRKRKCLKQLGGPKYPYDDQNFVPIYRISNGIDFDEPADFPPGVTEPAPIQNSVEEYGNRVKRSLKCPPPQIEVRSCVSYRC